MLPPLDSAGSASVSLWEVARIAFNSLLANKVRSLLTMLGVIIGVASVVALLALGNGASASITGQIQAIGTNLLTVMSGLAEQPRAGPAGRSPEPDPGRRRGDHGAQPAGGRRRAAVRRERADRGPRRR